MRYPFVFLLFTTLAVFLAACGGAASPTSNPPAAPATAASAVSAGIQHALVIGGGGPVGRAWDIGMLKGLKDAGVDVSPADLLVGTSSGANLATQVCAGKTVDSLYDALVAPAVTAPAPAANVPAFDADYVQQTQALVRNAKELTPALRMQVGQRALAATKVLSEDAQVQQTTTVGLGGDIRSWPTRALKIAAVDVTDGTVRFFDSTQGVPIDRAAAASNAIPGQVAPITIGDHRYMDGASGGANVDGAAGARVILVPNPGIPSFAPDRDRPCSCEGKSSAQYLAGCGCPSGHGH